MKRLSRIWLGLPLATCVACGWLAGVPEDPRFDDGGTSGRGGAGASSGMASSDAGASGVTGGSSGEGAGEGGSTVGQGGAPAEPTPVLGEPCAEQGTEACTGAHPNLVLICDGRSWIERSVCSENQRCSFEFGDRGCTEFHGSCQLPSSEECDAEGSLSGCGEDPIRPVPRHCPLGCRDGACLDGNGDQLIVHTERLHNDRAAWDGAIPVCFDSPPGNETLEGWIEDEAKRSWGRFLNVDFTGWDRCEGGAPGVVIEFLDECSGRLAGSLLAGSPGDRAERRVGICRSFYDAAGTTLHDMSAADNESLARFLTRHQFGHVLGLEDGNDALDGNTVMVRSLEKHRADELVITDEDIATFSVEEYAPRPPASILTSSGACLTLEDATRIVPRACADDDAQRWLVGFDNVESLAALPRRCASLQPSGSFAVAECSTTDEPLSLARAQWRTAELCVAPRRMAVGSPLTAQRCGAAGSPRASWSFEILMELPTELLARLRLNGSNWCLAVPRVQAVENDIPLLETCSGDERQFFLLRPGGVIGFDSPGADVHFVYVNPAPPDGMLWLGVTSYRPWFLSGAIESTSGLALTSAPGTGTELGVAALPPDGAPTPEQTFDVRF